ncbi:hypothetical protein GCM10023215_38810 [Pseudonocardia yuanmonensis]|uniref:Uncharacterized protein n=1 Tax=Pseudonocardia yuanmonensis TaxID=1095914 RepID=A0ABP8WWY3_9PSEU
MVAPVTIPGPGHGLVALALCVIGNDFRRWWGLAFVAVLASLMVLSTGRPSEVATRPGPPRRRYAGALAGAFLLVSAGAQVFPTWPSWDPGANSNISIEHLEGTG